MNTKTQQHGLTLIELLVTIFGFTLVVAGLFGLFSGIFRESSRQGSVLADSDQARKVSAQISFELRNLAPSATGGYGLATAQSQQITFYANVDGGSDIEKVRYYTQSNSLYRGITKPSGNPVTYATSNEVTYLVQKNLANGSNPIFDYYDGTYAGGASGQLSQPVNVTSVRYIKITMKVFNKAALDTSKSFNVTTGVAIRGYKSNLGD